MSDRSPLCLIVYDCPPEQREAVLFVINQYGLTVDFPTFAPAGTKEEELELGWVYGDDECDLDSYAEIAGMLMDRAPGATFRVWNDPKYEWLGGLMMYAPGLGSFSSDCDANGNPVFESGKVIEITRIEDRAERERAVGLPWLERMKKVKEPA